MSTDYEVKTVTTAIMIIAALAKDDFKGMTRLELATKANIAFTSSYRTLKTLESHGWVNYSEVTQLWTLDTFFMKTAFAYKRSMARKHKGLDTEFLRLSGEEYSNGQE
jgi:IclR family transcriptional regulator, acetate operon repressor